MPRKPRFFLPNVPVHAITRGNNRSDVFLDDSDKEFYLLCMRESSKRYSTAIHAYVLMDNHIHLLISSEEPAHISKFMQHIGRQYVPYFNKKYGRTGTVWQGRFKASIIDSEKYLLSCYRYIELNPVRAGMVDMPELYQWSSFAYNALGLTDSILQPHNVYLRLGKTVKERAKYYHIGFENNEMDDPRLLQQIRGTVQTGTPLGLKKFIKTIEKELNTKVGSSKRGRPKKGTDPF